MLNSGSGDLQFVSILMNLKYHLYIVDCQVSTNVFLGPNFSQKVGVCGSIVLKSAIHLYYTLFKALSPLVAGSAKNTVQELIRR